MNLQAVLGKLPSDKTQLLRGLGTPLLVLAALAMVVLPMPAMLLDIAFTFNIALALVVLMVSVYSLRPVDFAAFPTVLLIATLLRLALNVASTRVVLLEGHNGPEAAGKVIEAFGNVVIGGNYAVGIVVFVILMIINFMVVTKGAGRISEVSARFTLDAMPGKQMAIDADLNAGLIDQEQARSRREEVTREADFYGSMDGASKFVKGDAIAGILILFINIIGGFFIGMIQHGLSAGEALSIYTLLTIGDGLVAQIPSLLLSIAAAIMVTRQNRSENMGEQLVQQMTGNPKSLMIATGILFVMGIVPGMPHIAFLSLALACAGLVYWKLEQQKKRAVQEKEQADAPTEALPAPLRELSWDDVQPIDIIGLEVGYRLIPLVDRSQNGELLERIKGVRKKLSQDLGFLLPSVHIRDNLELQPSTYRIVLMGVNYGEAEIRHDCELAINPGQVFGPIDGQVTRDPAFGLEAVWIAPEQREHAQALGYTVVDAATVVATHISQVLINNASQLIGH
ncbi:MAG: flagellar biosynthesis protein FlhA, partial [Plesiomonas shigelloides]